MVMEEEEKKDGNKWEWQFNQSQANLKKQLDKTA
jgi:hypothetical protein